jgi:hypothetical protein
VGKLRKQSTPRGHLLICRELWRRRSLDRAACGSSFGPVAGMPSPQDISSALKLFLSVPLALKNHAEKAHRPTRACGLHQVIGVAQKLKMLSGKNMWLALPAD